MGDLGLIPGLGRYPGGGQGNPLQYFYLEVPMEREPGRLQSIETQKSDTTEAKCLFLAEVPSIS